MSVFYGQHGEDFLLDKIFREKPNGYFVEVGCLDGIEYSNTYYFEKKGWNGACIEAHSDFISALTKNRPNSDVVHCAVGEDNIDKVIFYANKAGSLSTLDKNEEERWKTKYTEDFHGFEEQQVAMRTLTSVFDELKVKTIDFISLDIEGYEVKALSGLDFTRYRPRVFVIEYKDEIHKRQLEEILLKFDYNFLSHVGCNLFYSLDIADKKILEADHGTIQLVKVDARGEQHIHELNLSKPSVLNQWRSALARTIFGKIWHRIRYLKKNTDSGFTTK